MLRFLRASPSAEALYPIELTLLLGERGYRFILFEAGHIAQNISLTATALELGSVLIGGFLDDKINDLIGVDGSDEAVLYLIALGRPGMN